MLHVKCKAYAIIIQIMFGEFSMTLKEPSQNKKDNYLKWQNVWVIILLSVPWKSQAVLIACIIVKSLW